MISQLKKFVHDKCEWTLLPWRLCYRAYVKACWQIETRRARCARSLINQTIERLRQTTGSVRVGFYVYNDAVFQLERVFQRMLADDCFDPYIVISWGESFESEDRRRNDWQIHQRAVKFLRERYGMDRVLDSMEGGVEVDCSDRFDLCAVMRPYDAGILRSCQIAYLAQKGKPVIYAHYGFEGGDVADVGVMGMSSLEYVWRFYTGSVGMKNLFERLHPSARERGTVVLSGNPKIEALAFQPKKDRNRKRIIVAPHHTINPKEKFHISNFVRFSDFLVSLPRRYPDIDWVFRPHPNLMSKMVTLGYWTEEQRSAYLQKWQVYPNATYQAGGPYYEDFVNSDAMVQDCSSFLAEYHATGHPQCYMLKSEEHALTQYNGFGLELLNQTYKAYTEEEICKFVEEVVLGENDFMQNERECFLRETLLRNFPNVSRMVVDDIKSSIGRA